MDAKDLITTVEPAPEKQTAEKERKDVTDRFLLSEKVLPRMAAGMVVIAVLFFALRSTPALLSLNIKTAQAHAATLSKVSENRTAIMDHKEFWYRIYESR